jgi:hypothetical protein
MRLMTWAAVAGALILVGCQKDPSAASGPSVARWRFQGTAALASQSDVPSVRDILQLKEASPVTPRAVSNVAQHLVIRLTGATNASLATQLHPLVQAVIQHPSAGEVTREGWSLALQVPAAVAADVQNSLLSLPRVTGQGGGLPVTRLTNGWLLGGSTAAWLDRAAALPALGKGEWFSGNLDLPTITGADPRHWPRIQLTALATNGQVRTRSQLSFRQAPLGALGEWKVPQGYVHDPLVRFTAARGIEPLVRDNEWFKFLSGGSVPDQLSSWSQAEVSFRTWFAAPIDSAGDRIARIQEGLASRVRTNAERGEFRGMIIPNSNRTAVAIYSPGGIKGILPSIGLARQGEQDFLLARFITSGKHTNPAPAELFSALKQPDLVYYDWELTAECTPHWNVLFQYQNLVRARRANALLPLAHYWMLAATPKLGNAVTTIRQRTPTEFELSRESAGGFTSLEWVLFTRWLDGPVDLMPGAPLPGLPTPGARPVPAPASPAAKPATPTPAGR